MMLPSSRVVPRKAARAAPAEPLLWDSISDRPRYAISGILACRPAMLGRTEEMARWQTATTKTGSGTVSSSPKP